MSEFPHLAITRRGWLQSAALAAAPRRRPNIVLLLADDMGWADPSCFGNRFVETPHLDRLAAGGTKFESFYAASAVCTPSRAAILTGRYPLRFDIRKHFNDDEAHLPETVTLPKLLRGAGYATGHVGKWHLGGLHLAHIADRARSIPGPHQHGFEHYQCQNEEQPLRGKMGAAKTLFREGGTCLIRDDRRVGEDDPYYSGHFTTINGDESVRLIGEFHRAGRPFFLNTWFLAPHMPYEPAPAPFWERAAAPGITDDQRRYRSMLMHLDEQVGRILGKLDELGIRNDTLVLFASDNGGAWEANLGPWKGGKTDLHEGGIRVPAIASWPGHIRAGATTQALGHHCDILPTVCAAAGVRAPRADGLNLLPLLEGRARAPRRGIVHWQIDHYPRLQRHYPKPKPYATEATREGKWKMLSSDGRPVALYDLEADPGEARNLLDGEAKVAARMTESVREFLTAGRDRRGAPR
ncbi:MAG: sulfatase-like hydrolase/transferase [Bryobacteraceae bacterium]